MKKIVGFVLFANLFVATSVSQQIDNEVLKKVQDKFNSSKNTALINAITQNSYKSLSLNSNNYGREDHLFTYEVKSGTITDQKQSGRCWMYTSLNVFRPLIINKLNLSDFHFSHSYLYFWDMFEKSNIFLERIISTAKMDIQSREVSTLFNDPISDGGAWHSFVNLVEKYGVVPQNVMPESYHSQRTNELSSILTILLRKYALELRQMVVSNKSAKEIQNRKIEMLGDVYKILVYSLGEPPKTFSWRYKDKKGIISQAKTYTPITFWKEIVGVNITEYVMLMDDPNFEYYKLYSKQWDRNTNEGIDWTFINIPTSEIKKYLVASLKDSQMVYFSCDVNKFLNTTEGTLDLNNYDYNALFGIDFSMSRKEQILTHQSGSTHGMALCGVDIDKNGNPVKWKLENSWGSNSGNKGFLTMTDAWFDVYFYRVVVHKKYLDQKVLDVLKQKPTEIPYYYPAFSSDN